MTKENKEKRIIYKSEIFWYVVFGLIWVAGLVLAILGVCAFNVGKITLNPLYQAQADFAAFFGGTGIVDFRILGSIMMVVSMLFLFIIFYVYSAKVSEKIAERRRFEERMKILNDSDETNKKSW